MRRMYPPSSLVQESIREKLRDLGVEELVVTIRGERQDMYADVQCSLMKDENDALIVAETLESYGFGMDSIVGSIFWEAQ